METQELKFSVSVAIGHGERETVPGLMPLSSLRDVSEVYSQSGSVPGLMPSISFEDSGDEPYNTSTHLPIEMSIEFIEAIESIFCSVESPNIEQLQYLMDALSYDPEICSAITDEIWNLIYNNVVTATLVESRLDEIEELAELKDLLDDNPEFNEMMAQSLSVEIIGSPYFDWLNEID